MRRRVVSLAALAAMACRRRVAAQPGPAEPDAARSRTVVDEPGRLDAARARRRGPGAGGGRRHGRRRRRLHQGERQRAARPAYEREHLFAFGLQRRARCSPFAPDVDGPVYALAAGPGQHGLRRRRVPGRSTAPASAASPGWTWPPASRIAGFGAEINWGDVRGADRLRAAGSTSAARSPRSTACPGVGLARLDAGHRRGRPALRRAAVRPGDRPGEGRGHRALPGRRPADGDRRDHPRSARPDRVQVAMFDLTGDRGQGSPTGTPTRTSRSAGRASTPTCARSTSPPTASTSSSSPPAGSAAPTTAVRHGGPLRDLRHRQAQPDLGQPHRRRLAVRGRDHRRAPSTSAGTSAG